MENTEIRWKITWIGYGSYSVIVFFEDLPQVYYRLDVASGMLPWDCGALKGEPTKIDNTEGIRASTTKGFFTVSDPGQIDILTRIVASAL